MEQLSAFGLQPCSHRDIDSVCHIGMLAHNSGIEGVDALENDDLVLAALQPSDLAAAILPGEIKGRHLDLLTAREHFYMFAQQLQIKPRGRLVIYGAVLGALGGGFIQREKIVVHRDSMCLHSRLVKIFLQPESCGGLSGAGGPRQQDYRLCTAAFRDRVCHSLDLQLIVLLAPAHERRGLFLYSLVDSSAV